VAPKSRTTRDITNKATGARASTGGEGVEGANEERDAPGRNRAGEAARASSPGPHARAQAWASLARWLILLVGVTHLVLGVMDLAFPPELPFDTELELYKEYEATHRSERQASGILSLVAALFCGALFVWLRARATKARWVLALVWTGAMAVAGGVLELGLGTSLHPGLGESVRPLGVARLATAAWAGHAIAWVVTLITCLARPWQPAPDALPSAFQ